MLLRFQVANHRSILDRVELSMIAVDEDRAATRAFDRLSERALTVAGIYGPNASGKSNVLDAIAWLADAVTTSLRSWDNYIPTDPHLFGDGPFASSEFVVDLVVDGVRHEYRLHVDDEAVLYESLHSYPERRRRTLFERSGSNIDFRRGLSRVSGTQELLTPTTLALSAAMRLGDPALGSAGRAIAGIGALGLERRSRARHYCLLHSPSARLFSGESNSRDAPPLDTPGTRASALELLRFADPGIDEVKIVEHQEPGRNGPLGRLLLIHHVDDEPVELELDEESAGTQTWFHLLGPALGALQRGQLLLFDEIDASLHPRLSARLVELFQDPHTNPRGAQLIFTSHDTSLLNVLNRDEVWLTEKKPHMPTRLKGLAEFRGDRVRKSVNLERAYLQGRFGAIPEVDQLAMREALGLIFQSP